MGVHLVLSVAIVIPIPGLRSAARFLWTLMFWVKARVARIWSRASRSGEKVANVHTPLVMVVALVPAVGGVAYLASPPLRKKVPGTPAHGPGRHQDTFQALYSHSPGQGSSPSTSSLRGRREIRVVHIEEVINLVVRISQS